MKRLWMVVGLLLCGLGIADPVIYPGGYHAPVGGSIDWLEHTDRTRLRKRQVMLLGVQPGRPLRISVAAFRVGNYTDSVVFSLESPAGNLIRTGTVERGDVEEVVLPDAAAGVYRLEIDTRGNAAEVIPDVDAAVYLASTDHPLGIVYQVPALYFWVPDGAESFTLRVSGQGRQEHAAFAVRNAAGVEVASGDSLTDNGQATISVPRGHGGVWSVHLGKLEGYTFEDVGLALGGDVRGLLAEHPSALLQPLMQPFARAADERVVLGVRFFVSAQQLVGASLQLEATDLQSGEILFRKTQQSFPPMTVADEVVPRGFLHVRLSAVLRNEAGETQARDEQVIGVAHGEMFRENPHVEHHTQAPVTLAERQAGFQVFARGEPGTFRPTAYPRENEIVSTLSRRVTPGEFETLYFALYPLADASEASIEMSPFADAEGVSLETGARMHWVRCWPQRTDWRSTTFHVIPELLEPRSRGRLRVGRTQPLAVPLCVPGTASPGLYRADVLVRRAGQAPVKALTLELDVLPFSLESPPGIVWGLYPDSRRWNDMPEAQIEAEMVNFREHGITALMLYPRWTASWSWEDGRLTADFDVFRTRMRLYRKVGLGGPMVISLQSADEMLRKLTEAESVTAPLVLNAYRQMLELIRAEAERDNWPEFCLHSVDEPHSGEKVEAAVRTLRMIKEAGFNTFNTCYGKTVREILDPYLDYRCYNNIGFLSFPNREAADALREETLTAGDVFWWYGTGCYTNRNVIQDGNVIANRFMAGYHFWRTRATGCWSWTFLRPKGDAYDDFDGHMHREYKDACIAYPTPDGKGLVSTLQWEGLREGIDDYKYLHTLSVRIRDARDHGAAEKRGLAERLDGELRSLLDDMPWTCRENAFTNADADRVRARIQDMILALQAD